MPPRCAVIQLIRNNEKYFKTDFDGVFRAMNKGAQAAGFNKPLWFFVENDSTDDTVSLAQNYGHVLTVEVPKETFLTSRCTMRTEKMANLRNVAINWINQFNCFDFVIWIDTDVTFPANTVTTLLRCVQNDSSIGLAGANTLQKNAGFHYYDTYALGTDKCLWQKCTQCQGPYAMDKTVDVDSAFGGLCVIRGNANCFFAATHNMCEHVYMCQKLKDQGFRIVVVGPARATWH